MKASVPFRLAVLLLLLACARPAQAQRLHHSDLRPYHFGFNMGLGVSGYDMTALANIRDPETGRYLQRIELKRKPGFTIGLIANLRLHNNIDLRFLPNVTLEQRDFHFHYLPETNNGQAVVVKTIESPTLNMPLALKFKTDYYKRVRVYTQLGIQPSLNFASTKKVRGDEELLKIKKFDVGAYAALGVTLYGERVHLSPELRFTRGFRDLYSPERTRLGFAIGDLFSQVLCLTVNLE